jgi:hypothetical protein
MARPPRVATGFSAYAQNDLLLKAQHILLSLTNNPAFATPLPDLQTLTDVIAAFALTLANMPGKANTAAKLLARNSLIAVLNQVALYVQMTAIGDVAQCFLPAFHLPKRRSLLAFYQSPKILKYCPCITTV